MDLSIKNKVLAGIVVFVIVMSALVLTVPHVKAATWTQDTDTDFGQDILNGVEIIGSGSPAYVQLIKDAMDWQDEMPPSNPGAREGPAMAYDSTNNVIVLFGGYNGIANLNDTWEYDPGLNMWNQVFPSTPPSAREFAGMTYDSTNNRIVLFGGLSDLGYERDTWEYNTATNTWQQTTPPVSPPPMVSYHLAFVKSQGMVLLIGQNFMGVMETWAYDVTSDSWADRLASAQPTTRSGFAISYHAGLDCVILFGGFDASVPPGTMLGDTWEYDWGANTWIQTTTTGPSARTSHSLSYRSSTDAVYLFGGRDAVTYFSDTWRYPDISGNRQWWSEFTQRSPAGRVLFGFTDETPANKSFVYGGRLSGGIYASDTWSLGPAFRSTGTLESRMFDSGGANVNWNTISWVGTSSPPTTILRFHLSSSNDPTGPWNFVGPGGLVSNYYTTPPETIWTGHDNERYLKFRAYFLTNNNLVTPTLDSVTIDYDVPPSNPYIIWTDPYDGQFSVPTDKLISIRFSETMNTGSVTYDVSPFFPTTPEWSESNSKLTLNHTVPMLQCKAYMVTILSGTDLAGNPLIAGPVNNPFSFTTICVPPTITATIPVHQDVDVQLNANIIVDFSEQMNRSATAINITPMIATTPTWSNGDTRVTYSHTTDFLQCQDYTVNITAKDLDGNDLIPGSAPNPWSFRTICTIPYVVSTSPFSLEIDVAVTRDIVVTFSEPMNTGTVVPNISPSITLTPTWSNGDKTVTYTHSAFATCTAYMVNMTGKDLDGNDLWLGKYNGYADNPWTFVTSCVNPYIVFTVPEDGETNVDQLADIIVIFSKVMDNTTVTWDLQPTIPLNAAWDPENKILTLNHTDSFLCGINQMTITGRDTAGNNLINVLAPNPWTFTPFCPNPYITSTDPANGTTGVPLDKNIKVTFNEPMNPSTLIYTINPTVTLTPEWAGGDTVLYLNHTTLFAPSQKYDVFVDGADVDGDGLIPGSVPNPWSFTTAGLLPQITLTDPSDGASSVPLDKNITVWFSEPMDTVTVSCGIIPPITLTSEWAGGDTVLYLNHTTAFAPLTMYNVTCIGKDLDGNDLVPGPVPNPWSFTTTSIVVPPQITLTDPSDGASSVPLDKNITVWFSEPMDTVTVSCGIIPPITLTSEWAGGDTVLYLNHTTAFAPLTMYNVTCIGKDLDGNDLVPGPVPNPWSFTTTGVVPPPEAPGGLQISRVPPSTIRLSWRSVPSADLYRVYESTDKFASFPWTILGTTTSPTFDANHLTDGLTHCYVVRAVRSSIESPNSTMAVKIDKNIGYSPIASNIYWFSLPYHSSYVKASDISNELTSSKIKVVAKWNPTTQSPILWYFFRNQWRGTDFTINPGDGLYIGAVSAFSWVIVGTDSSTTLSFTLNPAPEKNVHWISMPYTGFYAKASDIANELTSSQIVEVGLWNSATQTIVRWYWTGSIWTGTDFTFGPGDGIYIIILTGFNWQPKLITPEVA